MYYLGTISGASGAYYNNTTGVSGVGTFVIPNNTKSLYLMPGLSGLYFQLSAATGITSFCGATSAAQLAGPNIINGPFRTIGGGAQIIVGLYSPVATGCSVRVYASPTQ